MQPATRFYLLVALILCRKYFGEPVAPPPLNHGYKSTPCLFQALTPTPAFENLFLYPAYCTHTFPNSSAFSLSLSLSLFLSCYISITLSFIISSLQLFRSRSCHLSLSSFIVHFFLLTRFIHNLAIYLSLLNSLALSLIISFTYFNLKFQIDS